MERLNQETLNLNTGHPLPARQEDAIGHQIQGKVEIILFSTTG